MFTYEAGILLDLARDRKSGCLHIVGRFKALINIAVDVSHRCLYVLQKKEPRRNGGLFTMVHLHEDHTVANHDRQLRLNRCQNRSIRRDWFAKHVPDLIPEKEEQKHD